MKNPLGALVALCIGCGLGVFGFAAMREPMRFALFGAFNPQVEGYYQRMVLDRRSRIQLRMVGMFASFFGLVIFMVGLDALLRFQFVDVLSQVFLGLLWLSFISGFVYGLVDVIIQGIRGRSTELIFGWYRMWKQSIELGPVAAMPVFMPRMDKERKVFTTVYCVLVVSALAVALVTVTLS
jgi:hypothetical protein